MLRLHSRYLRLLVFAIPALGIAALFQNCGQTHFDTSLIETPARSPFFEKRVRIDEPENVQMKMRAAGKANAYRQQLSVLVNNPCAIQACAQDPDALVCRLQRQSLRPDFENSLQAYRYNPEDPLSAEAIEELVQYSHANNKCVIGIADERAYRQNQTSYLTDPGVAGQYHHQVLGSAGVMEYLRSLPRPTSGNLIVGMVDSGVQSSHEDLSGVPIVNSNFSSSCTAICNFHGNAVAGVMVSMMNNARGGAGLFAGNMLLYSAQVGNADGVITTTELVNGLTWLRNVNAEVINLSLGGFNTNDFALQDAMERAAAANISIVVAAGNVKQNLDEARYFPASFQVNGQINVASASPRAITMTGQTSVPTAAQVASPIELDEFSNFSPAQIHIAAPGKSIRTLGLDSGYTIASGTSFAAPMVTAATLWVRHYAKAAGLKITARQVKDIVLASTVPQAALEGKVQTQRYLNFPALKQEIESLVSSTSPALAQISLISSELVGGTTMRVTVAVTNANLSTGWTMRAYTNPDFLSATFTGQTCRVTTNTTCTFDISNSSMLVDPGVYLEIKDDADRLITDKMIAKTALNFGDRSAAQLRGAVVSVTARGKDVLIEGWACLNGFPDQLPIEVRLNSANGTLLSTIQASRWARGDYFAQCNSAEVRLGFQYAVPPAQVNGTARTLFFRALTPDGARFLDLPVYQYQPGYMDATPAQTAASVYIDPYLADESPTIRFTSVSYANFVLNITGTACFTNSRKPIAVALGIAVEDIFDMIPETRLPLNAPVESPDGRVASVYTLSGKSSRIQYTNASPRAIDNAGLMARYTPPFNDDTDEYRYVAPAPIGESNRLVRMGTDTYSNFSMLTLAPSADAGDGCAFPSRFTATYDVRQVMTQVKASIGVTWRPDMIPDIDAVLAARQVPAGFISALNTPAINRTIAQLQWSPRSLPISYAAVGAPRMMGGVVPTVDSFMSYFNSGALIAGTNTPNAQTLDAASSMFRSESLSGSGSGGTSYQDGSNITLPDVVTFSYSQLIGKHFPLHARVWADVTSTNVRVSSATNWTLVKDVGAVTLPAPASQRLLVALKYRGAAATPVPRDLLLEFQINGTGTWYQAPVAKFGGVSGNLTNSTLEGQLLADVNLPASANSLTLRLKAKGTQQFTLSRIGVLAQ